MRHHVLLGIGPARFRIGSAWKAPVGWLKALYRCYPRDEGEIADFTVRL
mgnify:FL=1